MRAASRAVMKAAWLVAMMVEVTVGKKVGWSAAWLAEKWAGVLVVLMAARWVGETGNSLIAPTAGSLDQNWVERMVVMLVGVKGGWWVVYWLA